MIFDSIVLGPFVNNVYFLGDVDSGEAVIVDATFLADRIVAHAKELGLKVRSVVLTHGHVDHIVGAGRVREGTGAEILIHEADRWLYEHVEEQAKLFGLGVSPLPPPDRWIADGDAIAFGRRRLTVMHTPGHTPGSVCLGTEIDGRPAVFTGDTLFQGSIGRTDLWGGDLERELASIRFRLFTMREDTAVYTGHGAPTEIGVERRSNPFLNGSLPNLLTE